MDQKFVLALAKRIEIAIDFIAGKLGLCPDVAFKYHYGDKNRVVGMDVEIASAADISAEIPPVQNWHPNTVAKKLVPLLESLATAIA
jgi:hypothetical protein